MTLPPRLDEATTAELLQELLRREQGESAPSVAVMKERPLRGPAARDAERAAAAEKAER